MSHRIPVSHKPIPILNMERDFLPIIWNLRPCSPRQGMGNMTPGFWKDLDQTVARMFMSMAPVTHMCMLHSKINMRMPVGTREIAKCKNSGLSNPNFKIETLPLFLTHANADTVADIPEAAGAVAAEIEGLLLGTNLPGDRPEGFQGFMDHSKKFNFTRCDPDDMQQHLASKGYLGPYCLVIPQENKAVQQNRYSYERADTDNLNRKVVSDQLQGDNLIMFQFNESAIRIINILPPIPICLDGKFKVVCCLVPHIREDQHGNIGVCIRRDHV